MSLNPSRTSPSLALSDSKKPRSRAVTLLNKIVFILLLAVIVVTTIPYGTAEPWWEAVFECEIFAITALWIFEALLSGSWQIRGFSVLLPLLVITGYAFAQTIELPGTLWTMGDARIVQHTLSIDRYQTYLTARKALALTLFLGLLLRYTSTPARFRWLIRVVIGVGLASALFGIIRQLLQSPNSTTGFGLPFLFPGMGYGQFIYHNLFAYLMEMTLGLVGGLVLGGGIRRDRALVYVAIGLFVWTAFVFSNSRGGILSFMCQSILLLAVSATWYSARRFSKDESQHKWLSFIQTSRVLRVSAILLMIGVLAGSVLWMGGERLADKLNEKQEFQEGTPDGSRRMDLWRDSWKMVKQHPWTGVGFGAYFLGIPKYQMVSGKLKFEQAHNDYLDLQASGGLVAICLAGWFAVMVIRKARYSWGSIDAYRRAACLGAVAGVLDVGVHSGVDFCLQITSIAVVFAALVVIVVADKRVESFPKQSQSKLTLA